MASSAPSHLVDGGISYSVGTCDTDTVEYRLVDLGTVALLYTQIRRMSVRPAQSH